MTNENEREAPQNLNIVGLNINVQQMSEELNEKMGPYIKEQTKKAIDDFIVKHPECVVNREHDANTMKYPIAGYTKRKHFGGYMRFTDMAMLLIQYKGREIDNLLQECMEKADEEGQLVSVGETAFYKPAIKLFGPVAI